MGIRFESCCLRLPLRAGLLIWGYLAMISIYVSILFLLYKLQYQFYTTERLDSNLWITETVILLSKSMFFIFHVILVSGLHKDSRGLVAVYRDFIVISWVLEGVVAAFYIPLSMCKIYHDSICLLALWDVFLRLLLFLVVALVSVLVLCLLNMYVLACVRSYLSILDGEEDDCLPTLPSETPETIVHVRQLSNC